MRLLRKRLWYNQQRNQQICALYEKGKLLREIGSVFHLTSERIRQILVENNVEMRPTSAWDRLNSHERTKVLLLYANSSLTVENIALRYGLPTVSLIKIAHHAGFRRRKRTYPMVNWNPQTISLLTIDWRRGLSASQIAKKIHGATRNAVIGKVHRLGLTRDEAA